MTDVIALLSPPFAAGLVLTGILTYLGIHVIERGIIFVDLALAQVAALGTTVAFLAGHGFHGPLTYWWSLGFTILGAGVFTLTRLYNTRIPQEAFIGIVYAVSAAGAILVMSKAPEGTEHLKDMLVGNILIVSWREIGKILLLFIGVGVFHWLLRKRFLLISLEPEKAVAQGVKILLWDFLFYLSFGIVVTFSVAIAGVLLVFSYLIVPVVCATLFSSGFWTRLFIGWGMGSVVSAVGVTLSYFLDLPTGATVICAFGGALLLCSFLKALLQSWARNE